MATEEEFTAAQARVKQLSATPPPGQLLQLYGLYKQANGGDVVGNRPGLLDFKGRAKFDAWSEKKGQSAEQCRTDYVELVAKLEAAQS